MPAFNLPEEHLRRVFNDGFTVRDIAESLVSFDGETAAPGVRTLMKKKDFDVVGVRQKGKVRGFAAAESLGDGFLKDHLLPIQESQVLPDSASLSTVVKVLSAHDHAFVRIFGEVSGIVTRSDLEKPPVRMWLFGIITLLEMLFKRIIEVRYPKGAWKEMLSKGRLEKAQRLHHERKRRNRGANLLDCLQYSDKANILLKDPEVLADLKLTRSEGKKRIKAIEGLRNSLAHAQDIVTHDWLAIVRLSGNLDRNLLRFAEMNDGEDESEA